MLVLKHAAITWLQECLAVHSHLPVELIPSELGSTPDQAYLQDTQEASNSGACNYISPSTKTGIPIQIVRLADELLARSISHVDLWCLDVEGYELQALRGAESLLQQQKIPTLYIALSDLTGEKGHTKAILDFMLYFDYQCFKLDQASHPHLVSEWPTHSNGLFLPI